MIISWAGESPDADTTVELPRAILSAFAPGEIGMVELEQSVVRIPGDVSTIPNFLNMLDDFPAWFPIASHDLKFGESVARIEQSKLVVWMEASNDQIS